MTRTGHARKGTTESEPWTRPLPFRSLPVPAIEQGPSLPRFLSRRQAEYCSLRGVQGRASPLSAPQQLPTGRDESFVRKRKLEKNTLETELLGPSALLVPATAICRRAPVPNARQRGNDRVRCGHRPVVMRCRPLLCLFPMRPFPLSFFQISAFCLHLFGVSLASLPSTTMH